MNIIATGTLTKGFGPKVWQRTYINPRYNEISTDLIKWFPDTPENRMSLEYPWIVSVKSENKYTIDRISESSEFLKFPPKIRDTVEIKNMPSIWTAEYMFDQKECAQQLLDMAQDWIYRPDLYPGLISVTGEGFDETTDTI
jgi:hypothetical protein